MKKQNTAKLMLSLSMIIFGTLGLFTRNIPVGSGELALYRAILASALIAGYFGVTRQKIMLMVNKEAQQKQDKDSSPAAIPKQGEIENQIERI